jgi:hypothetical protein
MTRANHVEPNNVSFESSIRFTLYGRRGRTAAILDTDPWRNSIRAERQHAGRVFNGHDIDDVA